IYTVRNSSAASDVYKRKFMMFGLLTFNACAQWAPGRMVINLGGFELGSTASLTMNSSTVNNTTVNNTTVNSLQPTALPIVDLSSYGKDRRDGNLKGYTNIMYPLAESAGFTATAAGSGGGCGGCG
ncbi:MAG: hypothetical protein QUS09_09685, partial [Methanotrichaceae archaeon]|nr:hypothetical protein [Methanotrichaceae archaeon]